MDSPSQWPAEAEAVEVAVTEREGRQASGRVYFVVLDKAARRKRAGIALAICWGLALCSLPVMFLHFFLVPLFLVLGPVMFTVRMRQERLVLGARVDCPCCEEPNALGKQSDGWPLLTNCEGCGTRLTIQPEPA